VVCRDAGEKKEPGERTVDLKPRWLAGWLAGLVITHSQPEAVPALQLAYMQAAKLELRSSQVHSIITTITSPHRQF